MRKVLLASTIALLGLTGTAKAHFVLQLPLPTNPADLLPQTPGAKAASNEASGKGGFPCGPDMMMAATPTAATGGKTITLKVEETVRHGGFYRVALALHSRSEIPPNNTVYDTAGKVLPQSGLGPDGKTLIGTSDHADWEATPVFPVLADHLFDHPMPGAGDQTYTMDIPLPNVNCDRCTLQVIEFMAPHGYNGTPGKNDGGGYFYQHCAELKITADPALPLFVPPGADGGAPDASPTDAKADGAPAGGGGNGGTAGTTGAAGTGGGTTGAAGNTTGAGGTTGTGGVTGSGGMGATGAAGSTTGAAGTTGAGGGKPRESSGGGCVYAGETNLSGAALLILAAVVAIAGTRRGRRS